MGESEQRVYLVRNRKAIPRSENEKKIELSKRFAVDDDGDFRVHDRFFHLEDYQALLGSASGEATKKTPEIKPENAAAYLKKLESELNWPNSVLDVTDSWSKWAGTKGKGVRIAVLDTGIDKNHPAFPEEAIAGTADFTESKTGSADDDGHGTHCAGIIAARRAGRPGASKAKNLGKADGQPADLGVPFYGVAPEAKLLIAKVLKKSDDEVWGDPGWVVDGIRWAIKQRADIITMSFAARRSSPDLYFAIHQALWLGKFVICAAGNDGSLYQNGIGYPGRYGGVITVAAHDRNGNPTGFSSTGGEVDLVGPGEDIWSTFCKDGESGYARLSGTSMAAPFVAGLAALIVSKHKDNKQANGSTLTNNEDLKDHLLRMAAHPGHHDNATGYGVLRPLRYFESDHSI